MVKEYTIFPLHAYCTIIDPVDTSQPHMFNAIVMAILPIALKTQGN